MNTETRTLPTARERAEWLHAYVAKQSPRFSRDAALLVVEETAEHWPSSTKTLARAVRTALAAQGVTMGHESALQAASRIQGHADYFHAPRSQPALVFVDLTHADQEQALEDWRACASRLAEVCERWLKDNPSCRLLSLDVATSGLSVFGKRPGTFEEGGGPWPIAVVRPIVSDDWLSGMASAFESLRRRVEESHRAILDGAAVVHFCASRSDVAQPLPHDTRPADVPYAELVLMRQDHVLDEGYEVVRGNESSCWQQLTLAFEGKPVPSFVVDDDGAWSSDRARFTWEVVRLRPTEYVPGLIRGNLPPDQSQKLLRRFNTLSQLRADIVLGRAQRRVIEEIDAPPSHCRLDGRRVLRALNDGNDTWERFCSIIGEPTLSITQPVALGHFMGLAAHLDHADPASLLARPTRSELAAVHDDHLLRALMPRVTHVRYRAPTGLDPDRQSAVREAVAEFSTSLLMRHGMFAMDPPLPDAVYAGDGEELRLKLESLGLVMFVGLMPHLMRLPEEMRIPNLDVSPYAYGTSLFVDVDFAS